MHKTQKKVTRELRSRLYDRRDRITEGIRCRIQECNDSGGYRLPDVIDIASLASTEQLGALVAKAELRELREIDDALARIDSGRYGVCKHCGGSIRKDRLKALPYATLCVKCKELEEEGYDLEGQGSVQGYREGAEVEIFEADQEDIDRGDRSRITGVKARKYSPN